MSKEPWEVRLEQSNARWDSLSAEQRQAELKADVRDMRERSGDFDKLIAQNRAYVRQRERQRLRPPVLVPARRSSCATRPRERRDGSRRHLTRGGPDDDPHPDPPALLELAT